MKLKKDFIVHNKKGGALLIPTSNASFSGIVQGNKTLGTILELLQQNTTKEAIVAAMLTKYDAKKEQVEADVDTVLLELKKIDALDE